MSTSQLNIDFGITPIQKNKQKNNKVLFFLS